MKKRFVGIGVATALTMSLGTAGLAFGAAPRDITEVNGTTEVSTTVEEVIPMSYTVTIPEKFTIGTEQNITVSKCILPKGKSLTISTAAFMAKGLIDSTERSVSATSVTVTADEGIAITDSLARAVTFSWADMQNRPKYADTYTGTATFTASVADTVA